MSLALSSVDYILNRICDLRACSWSFLASISVPFFSFWSFLKRGADEEKVAIEAVSGSATLELLYLVESIWAIFTCYSSSACCECDAYSLRLWEHCCLSCWTYWRMWRRFEVIDWWVVINKVWSKVLSLTVCTLVLRWSSRLLLPENEVHKASHLDCYILNPGNVTC